MMEDGGGASRSTDPAAGSSQATDVSLREFIEEKFQGLEKRLDERRESDQRAVIMAKETADAALLAHNNLIKQMESQAQEAQRQLDRLTETYATKENLSTLEKLLDQRLKNIEGTLVAGTAGKMAIRGAWDDVRVLILFGFVAMAGIIGLITFLSQR